MFNVTISPQKIKTDSGKDFILNRISINSLIDEHSSYNVRNEIRIGRLHDDKVIEQALNSSFAEIVIYFDQLGLHYYHDHIPKFHTEIIIHTGTENGRTIAGIEFILELKGATSWKKLFSIEEFFETIKPQVEQYKPDAIELFDSVYNHRNARLRFWYTVDAASKPKDVVFETLEMVERIASDSFEKLESASGDKVVKEIYQFPPEFRNACTQY